MDKFIEQIKLNEKLEYLFNDNPETEYECSPSTKSNKFTHLHKCVMKTREYPILNEYIDTYLKQNLNEIDKKNEKSWSALMLASLNSKTNSSEETVRILLENGADVNLKNNNGSGALVLASVYTKSNCSEETVRILLKHGADVNSKDNTGKTALIYASQYSKTNSSEETVRILLEHGADVNSKDNTGRTALMYASNNSKTNSSVETVRILLEHGADPNVKLNGIKLIRGLYNFYLKNDVNAEIFGLLITFGANFSDLPSDKNLKNILKEKGYLKSKSQNIINYLNQKDIKINISTCQICFDENVRVVECDKDHKICLNCIIKVSFKCEFCHPRNKIF